MAYVLDCSMAIAWQFRDESDALSDRALHAIKAAGAIVPQLWPYEIANALVVAERRGRITAPDVLDILSSLADLPITTEDRAAAPSELAEIARRQGISA
ncbi:MAG: type II toxin-antitoxin system VapC family toxin, partial [Alphaproteobacteria bacterium]|nr:type II toxin-antitoxin system VapC family toxin [Alphaproteobacteria bacterium]